MKTGYRLFLCGYPESDEDQYNVVSAGGMRCVLGVAPMLKLLFMHVEIAR
ncbi:hypothetical protein V6Z12_D10G087400 [Gossypium hirsutum]